MAIRILSDARLVRSYTDTAETCIVQFQRTMEQECGEEFTSLAVHNLRHLPADSLRHGELQRFSCFKYENVLAGMKREIEHAKKKPLVTLTKKLKVKCVYKSGTYSSQHSETARPVYRIADQEIEENQTWECYYGVQWKVKLDDTDKNGHFMADGMVYKLNHVTYYPTTGRVELEAQRYRTREPAFAIRVGEQTMTSGRLGIYRISNLQPRIETIQLYEFECKFVYKFVKNVRYVYRLL